MRQARFLCVDSVGASLVGLPQNHRLYKWSNMEALAVQGFIQSC